MTPRLHIRLLLWSVLLIALTVVVLDSILNTALRGYLEGQIEQQLFRESRAAASYLSLVGGRESVDDAADRLAALLHVRVTVIAPDGRVLGDSELDGESLQAVENHGSRPEVQAAVTSGSGKSVRYSATVHANYMYVATRAESGILRLAVPLIDVDALVREARWLLLYASLVALGFTALFSYFVSLRVSRPIREIAQGAHRLAAGDLRSRLPTTGDDEVAALGSALNSMAESLSAKIHELSEGKQRLETMLGDIRRVEKIRRDFVANVSHEFKTPLTSIRGYAETLLSGAGENPGLRSDFLKVIERNARYLETLVSDLLTLAKIEAEVPAKKEIVDVRALIAELLSSREASIAERGIQVSLECAPLQLEVDRSRLAAAVSNLIDNAVHYNRPGGELHISGRVENGDVFALDVTDTGYGIAAEELPRIFERFYRIDKARSRDSGGTGLGLAIAKHAIESQGGRISVSSTPGVGSTFTLRMAGGEIWHDSVPAMEQVWTEEP